MKSAYVVELSVQPGGARRANMIVCSKSAHVRAVLEWEFAGSPDHRALAADLAVFYGETIGVHVVQAGTFAKFVDLHPFLRAHVDGAPPILLDDTAAIEALRAQREEEGRDFVEEAEFDIDWAGIEKALPALAGDRVSVGEPFEYTNAERLIEELQWGWNDFEGEDEAPDDFPVLD
jgi:hypothetical protein